LLVHSSVGTEYPIQSGAYHLSPTPSTSGNTFFGIDGDTFGRLEGAPLRIRAFWSGPRPRRDRGGVKPKHFKLKKKKSTRPRKIDDELLKGIFEEKFSGLPAFSLPTGGGNLRFWEGHRIHGQGNLGPLPRPGKGSGKRIADLLAKVFFEGRDPTMDHGPVRSAR